MNFEEKIISLIETKREDDFWDFKEQWHQNNADLLHDIICLANNRVDEEAYLIIGVRDTTFDIIGIENDDNRKSQQNVIDFLNSKPFIGGIRPSIEIKTIDISSHKIDVIVIKNSTDTPYFLTDNYRDVRKYAIYTRIKDTNTPKDKCADINQIEFLWKKRFLLNRSPVERIFNSLKEPEKWKEQSTNTCIETYHNLYNPEYTISLISDEDYNSSPEFYAYLFANKSVHYGQVIIKYYNTEIYSVQYVILDGGRYTVPVPNWNFITTKSSSETITYKSYIVTSRDFIIYEFLNYTEENDEEEYYRNLFFEGILLFNDELEKEGFNKFIKENFQEILNEIMKETKNISVFHTTNDTEKEVVSERLATAKILKEWQYKYNNQFNKIDKGTN